MSFKTAIQKLESWPQFKQFKAKNKKAFLFSAFFILNSSLEIESQQLDYFIGKNKVVTFVINDTIEQKKDIISPNTKLTSLNKNIKVDLDKVKKIIEREINERFLTEFKLSKVFVVLQKIGNVQLWNVTCLMSDLKILRLHIDCFNSKILEAKEESLVDFMSFQKK